MKKKKKKEKKPCNITINWLQKKLEKIHLNSKILSLWPATKKTKGDFL